MKTFEEKLKRGLRDEWLLSQWLRAKGCSVIPIAKGAYDKNGPRLYMPQIDIIVPDMIVLERDTTFWAECKGKDIFTWYRKTGSWQTGFDVHSFNEYQEIKKVSHWPVKIFFLHRSEGKPQSKAPGPSPTGLFMAPLSMLGTSIHHTDGWGTKTLHYWDISNLAQLTSSIEEFYGTVIRRLRDEERRGLRDVLRLISYPSPLVTKLYNSRP